MGAPADRVYSQSHEWHKVDGDVVTVGITAFAVDQLTDVTYAEMKPKGTKIGPGDTVGEVESVKTTSDIYCACGGEIVEVNPVLSDNPGVLNEDPYGKGWLVKVKIGDRGTLDECVDAGTYDSQYAK